MKDISKIALSSLFLLAFCKFADAGGLSPAAKIECGTHIGAWARGECPPEYYQNQNPPAQPSSPSAEVSQSPGPSGTTPENGDPHTPCWELNGNGNYTGKSQSSNMGSCPSGWVLSPPPASASAAKFAPVAPGTSKIYLSKKCNGGKTHREKDLMDAAYISLVCSDPTLTQMIQSLAQARKKYNQDQFASCNPRYGDILAMLDYLMDICDSANDGAKDVAQAKAQSDQSAENSHKAAENVYNAGDQSMSGEQKAIVRASTCIGNFQPDFKGRVLKNGESPTSFTYFCEKPDDLVIQIEKQLDSFAAQKATQTGALQGAGDLMKTTVTNDGSK